MQCPGEPVDLECQWLQSIFQNYGHILASFGSSTSRLRPLGIAIGSDRTGLLRDMSVVVVVFGTYTNVLR